MARLRVIHATRPPRPSDGRQQRRGAVATALCGKSLEAVGQAHLVDALALLQLPERGTCRACRAEAKRQQRIGGLAGLTHAGDGGVLDGSNRTTGGWIGQP